MKKADDNTAAMYGLTDMYFWFKETALLKAKKYWLLWQI